MENLSENEVNAFDDICRQYGTWVIRYHSSKFASALFLVWYKSETGNPEQFLLLNTKEIVAVKTLEGLKDLVLANKSTIAIYKNLESWFDACEKHTLIESSIFDIDFIEQTITSQQIGDAELSDLTDFVNLYNDYAKQVSDGVISVDDYVAAVWNYYYDAIFWPRVSEVPPESIPEKMEIDYPRLLAGFQKMRTAFEERIKIIAN